MTQRSRLRTRGEKRRWRLIVVFFVIAAVCGTAYYSLFYRSDFLDQLPGNWEIPGWNKPVNRDLVRGTIYDRNYKELAVSYERVSVYANIREIQSLESIIPPLAAILGEPDYAIRTRLSGSGLRLWLARDITQKQEDEIRQLGLPGIFLHKEYVRYHPQKESAAHLLGFVENGTGLAGVEFFLNQLQAAHRINPGKIESLKKVSDSIPGADGRHLILTIDVKIQQILERYLSEHQEDDPGLTMGVLVLDATSGAIVGYAQKPSFDPNHFHTYPEPVFADVFNQYVAVPESFKVFLRDISLIESQSNGTILPWSVLAEKRKLGVQLQLWEKLGVARMEDYDFISTTAPPPDRVAFDKTGEGNRDFETVPVMLTPLQLLTALSRSVSPGEKTIVHVGDRYVVRRNHSEYLLEDLTPRLEHITLREGASTEIGRLLDVSGSSGQLHSIIIQGVSSSYKNQDRRMTFLRHHLSLALVPGQNPELVIMTVNNRPGYDVQEEPGDRLIVDAPGLITPIAARQKVMKNLADMMKPQEQEEKNFWLLDGQESQRGEESGSAVDGSSILVTEMPDLAGMSLRKSLRLLQNSGIEIKVNGTGRVVSHEPPAGSELKPGTRVVLNLERDKVDGGGALGTRKKGE